MRRLVCLVPLVFLAASLVAHEDRKDRGGDRPPRARDEAPPAGKARPLFDTAEFLKEHDRNKDGFLTKDELPARFRHNFDKLDANKDGKLSKEELEKGVAHLGPSRKPSDFVFVLIEMSDCDECCAEELQVVYDALRTMDRNHDGKITAEELKGARESLVQKRITGIFDELDTNKDGKISREEARGMIRHHFSDLDADKDGFVSRDELMKAAVEKPAALKKERPATGTGTSPSDR